MVLPQAVVVKLDCLGSTCVSVGNQSTAVRSIGYADHSAEMELELVLLAAQPSLNDGNVVGFLRIQQEGPRVVERFRAPTLMGEGCSVA